MTIRRAIAVAPAAAERGSDDLRGRSSPPESSLSQQQSVGIKGGEITRERRTGEMVTYLCLKYPGTSPVAIREAIAYGHTNGRVAAYRKQRRERANANAEQR